MNDSKLKQLLSNWVGVCWNHGQLVLFGLLLTTVLAGAYVATEFRMYSKLGDLIRQEGDWKTQWNDYKAQFPALIETVIVVVSSHSRAEVDYVATQLNESFLQHPEKYSDVFSPSADSFMRDRALLYLPVDELEQVSAKLIEAQPMLTRFAEDPSLRGVLELVIDGINNEPPEGFQRILSAVANASDQALTSNASYLWGDEFLSSDHDGLHYAMIFLKGPQSFSEKLPNSALLENVRGEITALTLPANTRVQLTGEVALSHEEIGAAMHGVKIAGIVSAIALLVILGFGVRSVHIVLACASMLLTGVVWTAALALLLVGSFNTISLIFLVMFLGLGVDFALHFCLRFNEALYGHEKPAAAIQHSTRSVGGAISLCTVTTAAGFMAFWPTDYLGLAELGIISAAGMLVAGVLTFSFLPAFFSVFGAPSPKRSVDLVVSERFLTVLRPHKRQVFVSLGALTLAALILDSRMYFDYSVLAMRDKNAESMRAMSELADAGEITDYTMALLSKELTLDPALERSLDALPEVDSVRSAHKIVPDYDEDREFILEELRDILWSAVEPSTLLATPTQVELSEIVQEVIIAIRESNSDISNTYELLRLAETLEQALSSPDILKWQQSVLGDMPEQLRWLQNALIAEPPTYEQLPVTVRARIQGLDGRFQHSILPSDDIVDVRSLGDYVDSVRRIAPQATGRPVVEQGVGRVVVESFKHALFFAFVAVSFILLLALRNIRYTLMVLLPLMLTAVFTVAIAVLIDIPFNMANILVLPLIFGLGVDNGIHVVDRFRNEGNVDQLVHSSTPRAVLLSTLTTIGTFASLSLSPHVGTASIGVFLTIAVGFILTFSIFLLPLLLESFAPHVSAAEE
ncbi:MAG: MMPL family transporter [Pseudomonadota bacterium]